MKKVIEIDISGVSATTRVMYKTIKSFHRSMSLNKITLDEERRLCELFISFFQQRSMVLNEQLREEKDNDKK
jgi:hypothetical protein